MTQNQQNRGAETIRPYDADGEQSGKTRQVEQMFDNIAPAYDRMNAVMSLGQHRRWREKALAMARETLAANNREPLDILDIASGTGDVAIRLAELFPDSHITGADISSGMLDIARKKAANLDSSLSSRLKFEIADCLQLPYAEESFDLITVAYGVRNFEHLEQGYREMNRVLRRGGVLCVIELSRPQNPLLRMGYDLYSGLLIPVMGKIASGDRRAYSYLPQTIAAAPQRLDMTRVMRAAGLHRCSWKSMTMGVVTIYLAQKL